MRIIALLVAVAALAAVPAALADGTYQTQKFAFTPVVEGVGGGGFVVNIHANGPNVFAHEQYVVKGLQPLTSYEVTLHVSLDAACASPVAEAVTATITTNPAGNGTGFHVFTPDDIGGAGLHGMTIHPLWTLSTGGEVVYTTGCQTAPLD